jgi:acyl-CoA thioesterase-1
VAAQSWRWAILFALLPLSVQAEEACPAGREPTLVLPHARQAMAATGQLQIVALGSSTTFGWMASSPANAYPAQLQADLGALFPKVHVNVLNRGIGGQDAAEEVLRLDSDAIAPKPSIVIWQVGANGAMAHTSPAVFTRLVEGGVGRLKAAGIDVVLMDNQRSPMVMAAPEHVAIEAAMAKLAQDDGVQLFSRGALMDQWKANGAPYERFISPDQVHHNDYGYRCLSAALATSMAEGLRGETDAKSTP